MAATGESSDRPRSRESEDQGTTPRPPKKRFLASASSSPTPSVDGDHDSSLEESADSVEASLSFSFLFLYLRYIGINGCKGSLRNLSQGCHCKTMERIHGMTLCHKSAKGLWLTTFHVLSDSENGGSDVRKRRKICAKRVNTLWTLGMLTSSRLYLFPTSWRLKKHADVLVLCMIVFQRPQRSIFTDECGMCKGIFET